MRKSVQQKKYPDEVETVKLSQAVGTATLSVGNLLLSTATTSNIDTAPQLGPR